MFLFVLGGLDEALNNIINMCHEQDVPFVFALGRKALGRACAKLVPVSCVGVFNYEGSEVCIACNCSKLNWIKVKKKQYTLWQCNANNFINVSNAQFNKLSNIANYLCVKL